MNKKAQKKFDPDHLKISLVSPYSMEETRGGVQEHIRQFANYLKSQGHKPTIIAPLCEKSRKTEKEIIHLGKAKPYSYKGTFAYISRQPVLPTTIGRLLKNHPQDIAHFHEPAISFPSMQLLWASHAYNFVTFHAYNEPDWRFTLYTPLRFPYGRIITGRIVVSEAAYKFANHYFPGKYKLIPNGINTRRFNSKNPKLEKFKDSKLNILFVGRLEERKGLKYLLAAYKNVRSQNANIRLIVIGDGKSRKEYLSYVTKNKIEDVHFEGRVSDELLPFYYTTADIYCSPATHGESFGIVLLEAMASGTPVIAGANPGYKNLITDGKNGFLVDPSDTARFVNLLGKLIANEDLRKRFSVAGLAKAKQYDWQVVGKRIVDYYLACIKEKRLILKKN